jgi:hypothetical protein
MNIKDKAVPKEKAFLFFSSIGNYTGESAASIEFHFYRGDFEKWFAETIGDKELAEQVGKLKNQNLPIENLRYQLRKIVSKRLESSR